MLDGRPGSSPLWQMVQHIVNHGSYHRGQLTTMYRQLGAAPAKSVDLISVLPRTRCESLTLAEAQPLGMLRTETCTGVV